MEFTSWTGRRSEFIRKENTLKQDYIFGILRTLTKPLPSPRQQFYLKKKTVNSLAMPFQYNQKAKQNPSLKI